MSLMAPSRPAFGRLSDPQPAPQPLLIGLAALSFTLLGVGLVNPGSLANFVYYAVLWHAFVLLLHRDELPRFSFAFAVSASFIVVYYLVQVRVYPDSYGTTAPLGSWTDDSYFYALVADTIPVGMELRDNYFLYSHPFTSLIRILTPLSIDHPMDVIFFQAGVSATLATFSGRFALQLTRDAALARSVFLFTLVCPFLMMNGGVILIRDTLSAALFVYSLCCIQSRRFALAVCAVGLQLAIRPGTALILLPAYAIIYYSEIGHLLRRHAAAACGMAFLLFGMAFALLTSDLDTPSLFSGTSEGGAVGLLGRELIEGLTVDPESNVVFLSLQELPFIVKLPLNAAYIFAYPFISLRYAFPGEQFDIRAVVLNIVTPVYAIWLNAWFVAGALTSFERRVGFRAVVVAVLLAFLLIGTYSLQTRHKTIIYPLFYLVIAFGLHHATARARAIGYGCSLALIALQFAFLFR